MKETIMDLTAVQQKVKEFDKKAGFNKTKFSELIEMLKEEVAILEKAEKKEDVVNHELTDILILVMQIAHRYNTDFDKELEEWFRKSKKYIKK
jgi:NTP pyrophosphatase (non-canonical NTP hydrolase)